MDLMQEHHIRELKDKAQRRDEDFESPFFQKVVSRNVRWFTRTCSAINRAVELKDRGGKHGSKKDSATINRLPSSLADEHVHSYVPGRSFGWVARDDLKEGRRLMPAKIDHFLHCTVDLAAFPVNDADDLGYSQEDARHGDGSEEAGLAPEAPSDHIVHPDLLDEEELAVLTDGELDEL